MDRPDLFAELGLRPLAVNGIVHGPDGVVFGRRPPARSISRVSGNCPQPAAWTMTRPDRRARSTYWPRY
jgi:hypothetical protein